MNKKNIIIALVVVLGLSQWFFFRASNTEGFVLAYQGYDAVATDYEASAHVPGSGSNVPRQRLNEALSRVLSENFTAEERLRFSEEGLASSGEIRKQIDVIKEQGKKTDAATEGLHRAAKDVRGFFAKRRAENIFLLAEERTRTIKDIEEISYGMNARVETILRGVITDNGALTPDRISALNNDLPEAERQFDLLMENYRKLEDVEKRIDAAFAELR